MKRILKRDVFAVVLTVVLSLGTAILGSYSFLGIGMVYAFFLLSPVIALVASKREFQINAFYVILSCVLYWVALWYWGTVDKEWSENVNIGAVISDQAQILGIGLCCSAFTTLPVYLSRRFSS